MSLKYEKSNQPVLNNITCAIRSKQKVALYLETPLT